MTTLSLLVDTLTAISGEARVDIEELKRSVEALEYHIKDTNELMMYKHGRIDAAEHALAMIRINAIADTNIGDEKQEVKQ